MEYVDSIRESRVKSGAPSKRYFSEMEDDDLPESLLNLGPSGDQFVRPGRKMKQSASMSPTRSTSKERISPRTSGYSSENIK